MKVLINTAVQRFGGAVQVALSFIYECRKFPENEYHIFVGPGIRKSLNKNDFPENFRFYDFDFGPVTFTKTFTINRTLRKIEKKIKPDCIISTTGPTYFHSKAPQIIGFNLPLYIYPESPYIKYLPLHGRIKLNIKRILHFYFFRRDADAYVVQTDDVNQRVRKVLKTNKVYTVSNTHNGFYINPKKFPDKLPPRKKNEIRLLTISAYYKHKNFEIIPEIIDVLKNRGIDNVKFILTIKKEVYNSIYNDKYHKDIITLGPVKPEECPSLYNECDIMFLPTLAECFSASYPEAMVMGKPIITTDLGFAHSICGEAALYYDPINPVSAAERIIKLMNNSGLQKELINKGKQQLKKFLSPEERAKKYLNICKEISGV